MGIVAIFFPRAYGKANRVIPRKHRTINPVAPHVSFLPRVEVAQAARRIARATKPRNRSPISARYYKFESISLQQRVGNELWARTGARFLSTDVAGGVVAVHPFSTSR